MQFPARVDVQLVDENGQNLNGEKIVLFMEFYLDANQRYTFMAGVSNEDGRITLNPESLDTQLEFNRSQDPEGFDTTLEGCDDIFSLLVVPGQYIDDIVEQLKDVSDNADVSNATQMYRESTNFKYNESRMVFDLSEVPGDQNVVLQLPMEHVSFGKPPTEEPPK